MCWIKKDKVLLLTGASSEVGCGLLEAVIDNYQYVWSHFNRSEDIAEEWKRQYGEKIIPVRADFSDENSVRKMITEIMDSGIYPDHIVHLASQKAFNLQFHKCQWEHYQRGIDTSLRSIVLIFCILPDYDFLNFRWDTGCNGTEYWGYGRDTIGQDDF